MQQRCTKSGVLGSLLALATLSVSVAVQAASQALPVCQEQDVVAGSTTPHDTAALEPLAERLTQNLRRMHCAAQRIMEEPTLESRKPYWDVHQRAVRAIEDVVTQLQLIATAKEKPPLTAFTRAFRSFRDLNTTIASDALLAETPAETAAARALAAGQGKAAFAQVHSALQPLVALLGPAAPPQGAVKSTFEVIASGFTIPWGIEVIGEEDFLFTERLGSLFRYKDGTVTQISNIPNSNIYRFSRLFFGGLMDVSVHPQFDSNNLVYIAYVATDDRLAVARFQLQNNTAQNLEVIFKANAFSIGSRIVWQNNTHFFLTLGLGGTPYPKPGAQNLNDDRGKIHRLMEDGSIPPDNPTFPGFSSPTSIWSYGHRNPQGLYYDPDSGTLYANEHGPLGGDELNIITKGGNYGWPLFSYGLNYNKTPVSNMSEQEAAATTILPAKYWGPYFRVAPSGLIKLSDSNFNSWNGSFLMGALRPQDLLRYKLETDETEIVLANVGRVRDVAQLPSGNLLILVDAGSPNDADEGRIIKLTPR